MLVRRGRRATCPAGVIQGSILTIAVASSSRARWRRSGAFAWIALLATLIPVFIYRSRGDLAQAAPILTGADPRWIVAALLAQLASLALIANKYRVLLSRLGVSLRNTTLARIHLRRHVVSTVIPFGEPAGLMAVARDLGRYRVSASTTLYCSFLISVVNEAAFALFLIPTLGWLAIAGRATPLMLAGVGGLLLIVGLAFGCVISLLRNGWLRAKLGSRLPACIADGLEQAAAHNIAPRDLLAAIPYALGVNLCGIAMLTCSLWAVGQHPSITTILAARVLTSITMLLLPIWQGAGAIELTAVGALMAGGVPAPAAIAAIAIYRIAQFWFPLALGGAAFVPLNTGWLSNWGLRAGLAGLASCLAVVALVVAS
jgi:uncharacterized membrane protein YbhN (UPF0104 family)